MNVTVEQVRGSAYLREDYLAYVWAESRSYIRITVINIIGLENASADLLRNEIMQAFLLGANRGIDIYRTDGGMSLEAYLKQKGYNAVRDYIREEFGSEKRFKKRRAARERTVLTEDLYPKVDVADRMNRIGALHADPTDYAAKVDSLIDVDSILSKLPPIDRSILELLVYGHDAFGEMRCASRYGSAYHHVAEDIALTIGMSQQYVYKRMGKLRTQLRSHLEIVA